MLVVPRRPLVFLINVHFIGEARSFTAIGAQRDPDDFNPALGRLTGQNNIGGEVYAGAICSGIEVGELNRGIQVGRFRVGSPRVELLASSIFPLMRSGKLFAPGPE